MDLHHLRHFVATAEDLNFGRAAQRLGLAQPALSRSIQRLEAQLGVRLFIRDRRSVRLTPAGELLLDEARGILAHSERAMLRVGRIATDAPPHLRIGFVSSALLSKFPAFLTALEAELPELTIAMCEAPPGTQIERIVRGDLDIGLVPKLHEDQIRGGGEHLRSRIVGHGRFVVALPSDHALAKHRKLRFADLAGLPFILFPRKDGRFLYDAIMLACEASGFRPPIVHEAGQMLSALMMVRARRGIAIVADPGDAIAMENVTLVPLDDQSAMFRHELAAIWVEPAATQPLQRLLTMLEEKQ